MTPWTRFVLRHRWVVLGVWLAVLLAGGAASSGLNKLLSNEFTVPGTDSEDARTIMREQFGQRDDGSFLVVFRVRNSADRATRAALAAALRRGAAAVDGGRAQPLQTASRTVVFGTIGSPLELTEGKRATPAVRRAVGRPADAETWVSGTPAIKADLDPIFADDLLKGEAIALPVALIVLLAVFGLSLAVLIPFAMAACTITATLGIVWIVAHYMTTAIYVTNLVQLIGLGIAIDYSLLVVYRFREELARTESKDEAIVQTMATAGRAVVFSGATVAIGPALLSVFGRRGTRRLHVADFVRDRLRVPLPRLAGAADPERGFWARLARSIMRTPVAYLAVGATVLVAAAVPVLDLELTPGSASGTPESIRGFNVLRRAVGPGALAPTQIVVEARDGSVVDARHRGALAELVARVRRDPEV